VALSLAVYVLTPKGPNQTVYRSSFILSFSCMFLMWAITYLAQLHPLIEPRRADLRMEGSL